jgi:hypothetical protein
MKRYLLFLMVIALISCSDRRSKLRVGKLAANEAPMMMVAEKAEMFTPQNDNQSKSISRKLIKNGTLTFQAEDVAKTKIDIDKICLSNKAYISSEDQGNNDYRLEYHQEIRVPADNFDQLLQKIEALGTKIESKTVNTQDVTEEFIDIEARLKTKKDLETRYRELLKLGKTVNDILAIETQIGNVRAEIESMEGRLNYLNNQVTFSTLKVTYFETVATNYGFASKFFISLRNGWENLLSFLIGVTSLWPFIILLTAMVWFIVRWRRKNKEDSRQEGATEFNT